MKLLKEVEEERYPELRCENCLFKNELDFCPLKKFSLLASVRCSNCRKMAYWTYYYKTASDLLEATDGVWEKKYLQYMEKIRYGIIHGKKRATKGRVI
jgi:hypothetical protein